MKRKSQIDPAVKARCLEVLTRHIGVGRAISMPALHREVFGTQIADKINGTRRLRGVITALRREGVPVCSASDQDGGGYYLASAGSEAADYTRRLRTAALKKLALAARIERVGLPELLGQIIVNLKGGNP